MKTEAQKRAQRRYLAKIRNTVKSQLSITIDRSDFNAITNYCKQIGMPKAVAIVNAIKYLMVNNVNLTEWVKMVNSENELETKSETEQDSNN